MDLSALLLVAILGQSAPPPPRFAWSGATETCAPVLEIRPDGTLLARCAPAIDPAPPAPSRRDLVTRGLIWGGVALHGIDLGLTEYAFGFNKGRGVEHFREANPFLRPFAGDPVLLSTVKIGVAVALNAYLRHEQPTHPKLVFWCAVGQVVAMAIVVHQNKKNIDPIR